MMLLFSSPSLSWDQISNVRSRRRPLRARCQQVAGGRRAAGRVASGTARTAEARPAEGSKFERDR